MASRRLGSALSGLLAFLLTGCSSAIGAYHDIEGGAIAQQRQPPPGADLPYPNLANVPPAPAPLPVGTQAVIAQQSRGMGVSPPSPEALAGLELPGAPPPLPNVPGLHLPATPSTPAPLPPPPPAPPPATSAPVSIAFPARSAILPPDEKPAIAAIAFARGGAALRVGGFGDGISLSLALARAQRLADALTARGVPPGVIHLVAGKAGSGGFVQLVY